MSMIGWEPYSHRMRPKSMRNSRWAAASLVAVLALSVSACSEGQDGDAVLPTAGDCYETWVGSGQIWVTMPLRQGLAPAEEPGLQGKPIQVREGDCPEGVLEGGRTLTLRRLTGVDPKAALIAPGEPGYQRRLFVPLEYRSAPDDRPPVPAAVRALLRRYAESN